jgi:CMP-N-acetylneuraminic acid synthetase
MTTSSSTYQTYENIKKNEVEILLTTMSIAILSSISCIKAAFNKYHKNQNNDISLIKRVSYQLQILFWCPDNQNEFLSIKICNLIVAKSQVQFLFA